MPDAMPPTAYQRYALRHIYVDRADDIYENIYAIVVTICHGYAMLPLRYAHRAFSCPLPCRRRLLTFFMLILRYACCRVMLFAYFALHARFSPFHITMPYAR